MCQRLTPKRFGFVLALFYHRDLPASHSLTTDHWPLFSRSTLHASPAGSGRAQTFPRWLLPSTDRRIEKDRTGPDLDERPIHIQYVTEIQHVTEPGNFFGQINPFLPARRRPTVNHSHGAGGSQDQCGSRRACRSAWGRDAHPLSLWSRASRDGGEVHDQLCVSLAVDCLQFVIALEC